MRWSLCGALAVLLLFAGCVGSDDASSDEDEALEPGTREDAAQDASQEGAPGQATTWTEDEEEATAIQGAWLARQPETSFEVTEDAQELRLNVSYEGDLPFLMIYPPDCEPDTHPYLTPFNCGEAHCPSEEGTVLEETTSIEGEWTVYFGACGALGELPTSEITLTVAQRVPLEGG